jgi:phospholipid/cholesterol/gamma-HCH transport system permease protein
MNTAAALTASLGRRGLSAARGAGALAVDMAKTASALRDVRRRDVSREVVRFGAESLVLALGVAVVTGITVVAQTTLYVQRFNARLLLGWAAGYAVLCEFGPLLLGLFLAARVGARNAAELGTLNVGGQLEGLRGISLDPFALIVAPRVVGIVISTATLSALAFAAAVLCQVIAAYALLGLPIRVFLSSFADMLRTSDLLTGLIKANAFGLAVALLSTSVGLRAEGGARAVGAATARAVVYCCAAVFFLDFALTSLLAKVLQ